MSDASDARQSQRITYQELCSSYRAIDTFRTALLGLLPVASGTAIFLLYNDAKGGNDPQGIADATLDFLGPIGSFGFFITLGLFLFEIYGIKKCHALIDAGKWLELRLGVEGQFSRRAHNVLGVINEPFASGIIYPAVLAAWAFVAVYAFSDRSGVASWGVAGIIFAIGVALSLVYNLRLRADAEDKDQARVLEQTRREVIEHTSLKDGELRDAE